MLISEERIPSEVIRDHQRSSEMDFLRMNGNASLAFTAQGVSKNRGKLEKR
jgi:hypothetical protein